MQILARFIGENITETDKEWIVNGGLTEHDVAAVLVYATAANRDEVILRIRRSDHSRAERISDRIRQLMQRSRADISAALDTSGSIEQAVLHEVRHILEKVHKHRR